MDQDVVQTGRGGVVAQRFERQSVVAGRQGQLGRADALVGSGDPARRADLADPRRTARTGCAVHGIHGAPPLRPR
ncbi:hypothetical protein, partial [Streptomyces showdoensis]|uniref:hypothetical protein n=1 Tax=Streptomyces showdoensis TaxID=68268 RepID=UPI0031E86686